MQKEYGSFVWDTRKEFINIHKHKVGFTKAADVFIDPDRKIFIDSKHSEGELRYFCIGKVDGKIMTVRFTYRDGKIRIYGAGYWRKGIGYYAQK